MQAAVSVPTLQRCVDLLGESEGPILHKLLKKSDFRSAPTLLDQINFIKDHKKDITVRLTIKLLKISNNAYYKAVKNEQSMNALPRNPPSRLLLKPDDEFIIIDIIYRHQLNNDCMSGKDIREAASSLYKDRTGIDRCFSRDWFCDFKSRHQDDIEKVKAPSIEDARAELSLEEVDKYINEIEEMMLDPPNPFLLINFDETGFGRRPDKGKYKTVYVAKKCRSKPFWREQKDIYHISLVMAITASCAALKPLCLSTRKTTDFDLEDTFYYRWGELFTTPKGYMTQESMAFWVDNILAPHVSLIRSILGEESRCVLIGDGCTAHFSEKVDECLAKIGNIKVIPLPSHSSHLTQMLDSSAFGSLKKRYSSIQGNKNFTSKYTRKLMKIKQAYESSVNSELIRSSWESTGFKINLSQGEVSSYSFSDDFKSFIRAEALHENHQ